MNHKQFLLLLLCAFVACKRETTEVVSPQTLEVALTNVNLKNLSSAVRSSNGKIAFKILQSTRNSEQKRKHLHNLAVNLYDIDDLKSFRDVSLLLATESLVQQDSLHLGKAYKNLGKYYIDSNYNDSSFYYYIKAEKIALELNLAQDLGEIYIDKAFCQLYESDFAGCEISASRALTYLDKEKFKFKIYDAYNLIGIASNELQNYEKALEYHNRALSYITKNNLNNKYHLDASSYNNIGYVYQNLNAHDMAIKNFKAALRSPNLFIDNPNLYAMLIDNLAYSKFKLGDFRQLPDLFYKSLRIRDSIKTDISGIILNKIHLSELFAIKQDTSRARSFAVDALNMARELGVPSDLLATLDQASKVDELNSITYSREYIKINDSLQRAERIARDKFARIAFETDEMANQNVKLTEQNRTLLYFFVGTIMIGALLFVIRTQRAKNRELLLKQSQQKANEEIYNLMINQQKEIEESRIREKKRIAQELHDGILGRLFGTRLNLDSLNRTIDPESVRKRLEYLNELKNIEQDIREISHDLSREKFVLINNFLAILNNLLENQRGLTKSTLEVYIDEDISWDQVSNNIKINLYRIIQEGLQNINKYAEASLISLQIKKIDDNLRLTLKDDGQGFDFNGRKMGIGLQNMVSRIHGLRGNIDIRSKKGRGTLISADLPIHYADINI